MMTTKQEIIETLKAQNPTLRAGSDEYGYVELTAEEYEFTLSEWADAQLAKEAKLAQAEALADAKIAAQAKLAALGLTTDDLKALGL
jgi:hypothetical protein